MTDAVFYPSRPSPAPTSAYVTGCEVLTWIAFGESKTQHDILRDDTRTVGVWGTDQLNDLHVAVSARAQKHYYTPLAEAFRRPWFADVYIGQSWANTMRAMRGRARRRDKRLVTFPELADELGRTIATNRSSQNILERATRDLMEALRAEQIIAFGQRHFENGHLSKGALHIPVPIEVLIHPDTTITLFNEITTRHDADGAVQSARAGMAFSDVRFKTADVLTLWPAYGEDELGGTGNKRTRRQIPVLSDRSGAPGRPSSKHLVIGEYLRREDAGNAATSIKIEGAMLSAWLTTTHPTLAPMTAKTAENAIRIEFNERAARTKI